MAPAPEASQGSKVRSKAKNVHLVGPHSTGKSTLIHALLEYYGSETPILFEIARIILKEKGYSAATITSPQCLQMQMDILQGQFAAEQKFINQDQVFISDRNTVDPIVYAKMYSPNSEDWSILCGMEEWKIASERYLDQRKSLVILLEPVKNFLVDDGTRKMPTNWDEWIQFGQMYSGFLQNQNIPYQVLGESCELLSARVEKVIEWVGLSP